MNSFVQALLIGLVYWVGTNRIWYATTTVIRQPLVMAVPLGLIMGDPVTAMVIGANSSADLFRSNFSRWKYSGR